MTLLEYRKFFIIGVLCFVHNTLFAQTEERIVLFGQQALEMVQKFGGKEKVVGVGYLDQKVKEGDYPDWPILTHSWPSKEAVLKLRPTYLFGMESAFKAKRSGSPDFWKKNNTEVVPVFDFNKARTLDVFLEDLRAFGKVFDKEAAVEDFIQEELAKLKVIKDNINIDNRSKRGRVLFLANVRSQSIFYNYTPNKCLMGEIVEELGMEFLTSGSMSVPISIEHIVLFNPDYIIISNFQINTADGLLEYFYNHPVLSKMKAVKEKQILTVDYSNAVSGGLEFVSLYQKVQEFLYPDSSNEKQ
ncbi:ABC transporter substrate-binding protein [Myroides injenensis]|uniref:ABC transporter substrate-binding protein n=1 Tax=Myroides injenensis TaxID=1183151 RepID=UPI000288F7CF|nr:ABC transporter substrate-binding protein [Myroides injenensis]